jgi:thiol-disulfide isomerase/thioredoxin
MRFVRLIVWLLVLYCLSGISALSAADKNYDAFAQCLTKKKVVMYGAYWCPHCADQKKEFGSSFRYIHYVECAVPGQPPNVQPPACSAMQIHKYPTWVFPDGERVEANMTLEKLSEKTGCKLP